MGTVTRPETKRMPLGKVRFDRQEDGRTLAVHVDRKGFRRLLQTLERLAETGGEQRFKKSGRARTGTSGNVEQVFGDITELVFHLEDD